MVLGRWRRDCTRKVVAWAEMKRVERRDGFPRIFRRQQTSNRGQTGTFRRRGSETASPRNTWNHFSTTDPSVFQSPSTNSSSEFRGLEQWGRVLEFTGIVMGTTRAVSDRKNHVSGIVSVRLQGFSEPVRRSPNNRINSYRFKFMASRQMKVRVCTASVLEMLMLSKTGQLSQCSTNQPRTRPCWSNPMQPSVEHSE